MKLNFTNDALASVKHRCLVALATKDGKTLNGSEVLDGLLEPFVASGEFGKSAGGSVYLINPEGVAAERVLLVNIGEKVKNNNDYRKATASAWKGLRGKGIVDLLFSLDGLGEKTNLRAALEGFILGDYQFSRFKSETDKLPASLESLTLHGGEASSEELLKWQAIAEGTCRARDLCQTPANVLTPVNLAEQMEAWAGDYGFTTQVLSEEEIEKEGMGAMMAVGKGSANRPRFIIMEYKPENPSGKTIAFVGKAVTFDSGGLNIKTSKMEEMKGDMGGGAAVCGIMSVLKAAGCKHHVIGLVPSVENMPSSNATRPSDVVTSLSGITIEINNTDAEGRLIMADALTYAARYKPDYVVDFATLTGACVAALGPKVCGVMGNHQPLVDHILAAGNDTYELFWQLPLVDEYNELLKSQTADVSNIGSSRWGGAITAGLFLQRFAGDYQWAHCDIASSIFEKGDEYSGSGGNGVGVRMMVEAMERI